MFKNRAAKELGLKRRRLRRVRRIVKAARLPHRLVVDDVEEYRDTQGRPFWEISFSGTAYTTKRAAVEFRFQINVFEYRYRIGSSRTPDWFQVTTRRGKVLFVGDVEHPNNNDDKPGWARYRVFSPVRRIVEETELAALLTGREPTFDVTYEGGH
jgi:hypothetical protein